MRRKYGIIIIIVAVVVVAVLQVGYITLVGYYIYIIGLINKLESD